MNDLVMTGFCPHTAPGRAGYPARVLRRVAVAAFLFAVLAPGAQAAPYTLVELSGGAAFMGEPVLRAAGATEISPSISMWRVRTSEARRLLPSLRRAGIVYLAQPDRPLRRTATKVEPTDPLFVAEWWLADVGADRAVAPGPGVPVAVVDTGVDLSQPEFAGRSNTFALNAQSVVDSEDDFHGTAVASVVAAPANGVGIVGVYPQAVLRVFDADLSGGLTDADADFRNRGRRGGRARASSTSASAASAPTPGCRTRSTRPSAAARSSSPLPGTRATRATRSTSRRTWRTSSPSPRPTGATSPRRSRARRRESTSPPRASGSRRPSRCSSTPTGYESLDGTSFSAPIVSGAAALGLDRRGRASKNTQIFDLMRWSARDVGAPGFDEDTGFGILDIPNALALAAPAVDPQEPNDDVDLVKPGGLFRAGTAPLTSPSTRSAVAEGAPRLHRGSRRTSTASGFRRAGRSR